MLRIQDITQARQQRTLRALYAQTQAYPYAAYLSPSTWGTAGTVTGSFTKGSGTAPGTGGNGPIYPGMVAALTTSSDVVAVAVGGTVLPPFGLFANFIGGVFDEIGSFTEVGIWRGQGAVFEILNPAFNSNVVNSRETSALNRRLFADANGLLNINQVDSGPPVARLIDWVSAKKIVVELGPVPPVGILSGTAIL